jgi:hypothetical protein
MDPITALGFAANILQFIDFSAKVVGATIEIYESASGRTTDTQNSDAIATEMRLFATKLQPPDQTQLTGEERSLCKLATECEGLAQRIIDLLEKVRPKKKSKSSSLVAGLKTKYYESERRKLEEQLGHCRAQLNLQLNLLTRYAIPLATVEPCVLTFLSSSESLDRLEALVTSAKDNSTKLQNLHSQMERLRGGVAIESLSPTAQAQLRSLLGMSDHAADMITQHRILESLSFDGMYGRYETVDNAHIQTLRWIFGDDVPDDQSKGGFTDDESEDEPELIKVSKPSQDDVPDDQPEGEPKSAKVSKESQDDAKISARKLLVDWLSSGKGIFHISGKLGSGKSTLMKYLVDNEHTKSLLQGWAGRASPLAQLFLFIFRAPQVNDTI